MPIDYSFDATPGFRDLTQSGLVLLSRPLVRPLRRLERLRRGDPVLETPATLKTTRLFRRGPLSGSLY